MSGPALSRALERAGTRLGGSVTWINPAAASYPEAAEGQAGDPEFEPVRVGVKDTEAIPAAVAGRLTGAPGYLWLTIDRASPGGRAVDTGLINPLTGRPMTGSTSGGAVNVLEGITDLALGTDGGGSVLGPALACNLYGVLGAGLGLKGTGAGLSTDGRTFVPGLGLIGRRLLTVYQGLDLLLGEPLAAPLLGEPLAASLADEPLAAPLLGEPAAALLPDPDVLLSPLGRRVLAGVSEVVVPARGSLVRPDGLDMFDGLAPALIRLEQSGIRVRHLPMDGADSRSRALEILSNAGAGPVLTLEGPVDWYGLGDSVLGSLGPAATAGQAASGKYLLRAANMHGATAVAVPVGLLSSGFLVIAPPGTEAGQQALALAALLDGAWPVPELVTRYFGPGRRQRPGFPRPEGSS